MKNSQKQTYLFVFGMLLLVDVSAIAMNQEDLRFFSKPLLMPFLSAYFLQNVSSRSFLRDCILAALFFSWTGDVLLMFQTKTQPIFFLLGLSAFLVAHLCYIGFYHRIRITENIKGRWWLVMIVAFYYAMLITLLYPDLGDMRIPVLVYGIVISFMLLLALHMSYISNKIAGRRIMTGAILFVISDSLLAVNRFSQAFSGAGIMIMLTYGLAQYFMVTGALRYISSKEAAAASLSVS